MFLIGNSHIHCLELDYPVDSSSLPVDLKWMSFVSESALRKMLHGHDKKCWT